MDNERIKQAKQRWEIVCWQMDKGTWSGTEAEALAEIARCRAIIIEEEKK